jgi:hypothetical protein
MQVKMAGCKAQVFLSGYAEKQMDLRVCGRKTKGVPFEWERTELERSP